MSDARSVKTIRQCAQVLFDYAKEKNILHNIYKDLLLFSKTCDVHKNFFKFLIRPTIGHVQKCKILHVLFKKKMCEITLYFFESIIHQHQADKILKIVQYFLLQYAEFQGIKRAHLITAFSVSSDEIASLKRIVQYITPCKKIILSHHIDPLLIGGYVLEVDNKKLDKSLKNNLHALKKYILA